MSILIFKMFVVKNIKIFHDIFMPTDCLGSLSVVCK